MIFGTGPLPFLFVFSLGTVASILYRLASFILKKIKANKLLVHTFDFLFVITVGVCYYFICFYSLDGKFRLFTVFGLISGIAVEVTLSRVIKNAIIRKKTKEKR